MVQVLRCQVQKIVLKYLDTSIHVVTKIEAKAYLDENNYAGKKNLFKAIFIKETFINNKIAFILAQRNGERNFYIGSIISVDIFLP